MIDRFYVGGDLGKREIKAPISVVEKLKMHSYSELRSISSGFCVDVVRVYNPKIEEKRVIFEEEKMCDNAPKVLKKLKKFFGR